MMTAWLRAAAQRLRGVHRCQSGAMSIVSVFTVLVLVMLMGMVLNVGRATDGKLRMQNAADAAAYSGGVVIARGMNALAFTNHLLCEVFAITAFMREAQEENAASHVPDLLAAWRNVSPAFGRSEFERFRMMHTSGAIQNKTLLEQSLVELFSALMAKQSEDILPTMEAVLAEEMIPQYQRAVVEAFPDIAQTAVMEVSKRNGEPDHGRGPMLGALWRTTGAFVGGDGEAYDPSLPVVDPVDPFATGSYLDEARQEREQLARHYLDAWNQQFMSFFSTYCKMSSFAPLWRGYTCGQLEKLLAEYANTNVPFQIRTSQSDLESMPPAEQRAHLEQYFSFVAVVYWKQLPQSMPGLYRNPLRDDCTAFAETSVFFPKSRLKWRAIVEGGSSRPPNGPAFHLPGGSYDLPWPPADPGQSNPPGQPGTVRWIVDRQHVPVAWDLMTQHWKCQLVPATGPNLHQILSTPPPVAEFDAAGLQLPDLTMVDNEDIAELSSH